MGISSAPVGSRQYIQDIYDYNQKQGANVGGTDTVRENAAKTFGFNWGDSTADPYQNGGYSAGPSPAVLGDPTLGNPGVGNSPPVSTTPAGPSPVLMGQMIPTTMSSSAPKTLNNPGITQPSVAQPVNPNIAPPMTPSSVPGGLNPTSPSIMNNPMAQRKKLMSFGQ